MASLAKGDAKIEKKSIKKKNSNASKTIDIYMDNILTRKIKIAYNNLGRNIVDMLQTKLVYILEGRCAKEGYIKKDSIKILSYSAGIVEGNNVIFDVSFECKICRPVEGQKIKCRSINKTKAGIRACYYRMDESPIIVFITRDHNYNKDKFKDVKENDEIIVKVIGIRYQLNDDSISIIAEYIQTIDKQKPKLSIKK